MSAHQTHLALLFIDAFRHFESSRPAPDIDVRFYPYAGLNHTIRLRSGKIYVRIADILKDAPSRVHRALAFTLVAKLLRRPVPEIHLRSYRDYACTPEALRLSDLARKRRGRKIVSGAHGRAYDLDRIFNRLNRRYFDGELPKPSLTWSQRRTRRILGHHDAVHDTIVVSKTLDAPEVPEWFVEFILYHEMLHIKHPARLVRGRRVYHTKAFRHDEQRFARYQDALALLDRNSDERRATSRARAA
ncbi:MAG: M48 family peptidase [Pyrinomonadaceae bacterium]|nr:M48 family peptidase [Pyrinomonadaceae bacterium]